MGAVPINRTRALITCTRPQDYLPGRLREAARYLLDRKDATEEERRLAPRRSSCCGPNGARFVRILTNLRRNRHRRRPAEAQRQMS